MDRIKLIFQIIGSVILTLGVWIAVDKYNFLRITKLDAIIKVQYQIQYQNNDLTFLIVQ